MVVGFTTTCAISAYHYLLMEEIVLFVYGLWCLTTLSTIFEIYRGVVSCIGG
jgi:hypothetical protein